MLDRNLMCLCEEYFIKNGTDQIKFNKLSEEQQFKLTKELIPSIYKTIKFKSEGLDFRIIEKTKGDITKLHDYTTIKNSLSMVRLIVDRTHSVCKRLDTVELAMQNLISRKNDFMNGFKLENEILKELYNNITLAIIVGTSLLIIENIEYTKNVNDTYYDILYKDNKETKDLNYFSILDRFNSLCSNGGLNKIVNKVPNKRQLTGTTLLFTTSLAIFLFSTLSLVIPILRESIYIYYHTRVSLADYFRLQASFLEANVSSPTISLDKKTKDKQNKTIDRLLKLADKIDVDQKVSSKKAKMDIQEENKQISLSSPKIKKPSIDDNEIVAFNSLNNDSDSLI